MFVKHFVRFNTREQLEDSMVIEYFDVVQSVIPTKLITGISSEGDKVSVDVLIYNDMDNFSSLTIILALIFILSLYFLYRVTSGTKN